MAYIPVPNTAMVEIFMVRDGQRIENTLYFLYSGGTLTDTLMAGLLNDIDGWVDETWRAQVPANVSILGYKATDLSTQTSPVVEQPLAIPYLGEAAGTPLPNNVTATVKFTTLVRGRSGRGRNYWPGFMSNQVTNNQVNVANRDLIVAAYEQLPVVLSGSNFTHVVVSRYSNNAPRATGLALAVVAYSMDLTIDSMRRRLPGRGE